jgi:hypothetical protein
MSCSHQWNKVKIKKLPSGLCFSHMTYVCRMQSSEGKILLDELLGLEK